MVNFGKKLVANQVQEWKGYYINYKLMKKKVRQYIEEVQLGGKDRRRVLKEFSKMLDDQVEKTVLFLLEQQGILASRIEKLGKERSKLSQQPALSKLSELRDAYRAVGYDLLKLLKFVDLNATGIRKILKKFDKHFGYRFTDYYLTSRSNHPYSQLQQVLKHVGIGAVVGALSRNLADLQDREGSYLSIYDQPLVILKDPVFDLIQSSVDKLTRTTNLLQFLGQASLIIQEDLQIQEEEEVEKGYDFMSLVLNLANTFLYMVNTYIIVPTADDYSTSLGAAATVCGVVIGSMAVAQIFSSVYFSAWSNKSYFRPLVFSSIMLLLGNILYAVAYDCKSLTVLLLGRLLCGLGSARAVNRRYISDCVSLKHRLNASASFVTASALGMASGPALAALLVSDFKLFNFTFNQNTLPGWVMALAWFLYLVLLWFLFKEPLHDDVVDHARQDGNHAAGQLHSENVDNLERGLVQPLLLDSEGKQDDDVGEDNDDSEEAPEDSRKPANSFLEAYKLLTPAVKVQLLIYFMLKYAMEIVLSESSVITDYYFKWNTTYVAIFLALLGTTVLPVNFVVGNYISNMFEERQLLLASELMVLVGVILSFKITSSYSMLQYISSGLITFVSAEVLEGVNLALLSRVMSSRLARGTYNNGLLSTEAGTIARVIADATITLAGFWPAHMLLNLTLAPPLLISVLSIVFTFWTYHSFY